MTTEKLICHKCKGVLFPEHMGHKCPYCGAWTYFHMSREAITELNELNSQTSQETKRK